MWSRLTTDDLELVLAADELDKLSSCSISEDKIGEVLQEQLDMVADSFRGSFQSKGYEMDVRDHYVPPEYRNFVLNYARYQIFTRFPMAENYALSEPRKKQYEEAQELLKNPYIGVSKPDYSTDPDLSGRTDLSATHDAEISIPWQKFPAEIFDTGFAKVYPYTRTLY